MQMLDPVAKWEDVRRRKEKKNLAGFAEVTEWEVTKLLQVYSLQYSPQYIRPSRSVSYDGRAKQS